MRGLWMQERTLFYYFVSFVRFILAQVERAEFGEGRDVLWFFLDGAFIVDFGLDGILEKAVRMTYVEPDVLEIGRDFRDTQEVPQSLVVKIAFQCHACQVVFDLRLFFSCGVRGQRFLQEGLSLLVGVLRGFHFGQQDARQGLVSDLQGFL